MFIYVLYFNAVSISRIKFKYLWTKSSEDHSQYFVQMLENDNGKNKLKVLEVEVFWILILNLFYFLAITVDYDNLIVYLRRGEVSFSVA